mmetsp:Transcript_25221/g.50551  ORF Transcript_25221/g.50551 Transcript_25221/m.50551 type:complete len:226 (-) Transcript_25221:251-928(-)
MTSRITSFADITPTTTPLLLSTTGRECNRCFAIISAAVFIKSFVPTTTGSLVIISLTLCPKILLAVSPFSKSPTGTNDPTSSLGKKSNELTNPTRRFSYFSILVAAASAILRRSTTGAPETPAARRRTMASSTEVWGERVKGSWVMRSETMRIEDLAGVLTKTRFWDEDEGDVWGSLLAEKEVVEWRRRRRVSRIWRMDLVILLLLSLERGRQRGLRCIELVGLS